MVDKANDKLDRMADIVQTNMPVTDSKEQSYLSDQPMKSQSLLNAESTPSNPLSDSSISSWTNRKGYIPLESPPHLTDESSVDDNEGSSNQAETAVAASSLSTSETTDSGNPSKDSFVGEDFEREGIKTDTVSESVSDQNEGRSEPSFSVIVDESVSPYSQVSSEVSQLSLSPPGPTLPYIGNTDVSSTFATAPLLSTIKERPESALPAFAASSAVAPSPQLGAQANEVPLECAVKKYVTNTGCLGSLPDQRKNLAHRNGVSFTLMVAGESGSGKSTFVQMLLGNSTSTNRQVSKVFPQRYRYGFNAEPSSFKRTSIHRTTEIEIHQCIAEENGFEARFRVVDTPGFGDYTNNMYAWVPITNYIDSQYQRYMCGEEQPCRDKLSDNRVHVCIYFLQPSGHDLLPLDVTSMKEIGSRVNLVPVISKADSLTVDEIARFKQTVRDSVAKHDIPVFAVDDESSDWPYALVSSTDIVRAFDGREVHGRKYDWGTVEVDNPLHSDLPRLKQVLIGKHMLTLIDTTHEKHYRRLRRELRLYRLSKALKNRNNEKPQGYRVQQQANLFSLREGQTQSILKSPVPVTSRSGPEQPSIEELARNMTGLEILTAVLPFGYRFLEEQRGEEDLLQKQRVHAIKNQFSVVLNFQMQRFEQEAAELEKKRQQFEAEIEELNATNKLLEKRVAKLEAQATRRKKK